jgi:hypothetical protein
MSTAYGGDPITIEGPNHAHSLERSIAPRDARTSRVREHPEPARTPSSDTHATLDLRRNSHMGARREDEVHRGPPDDVLLLEDRVTGAPPGRPSTEGPPVHRRRNGRYWIRPHHPALALAGDWDPPGTRVSRDRRRRASRGSHNLTPVWNRVRECHPGYAASHVDQSGRRS